MNKVLKLITIYNPIIVLTTCLGRLFGRKAFWVVGNGKCLRPPPENGRRVQGLGFRVHGLWFRALGL